MAKAKTKTAVKRAPAKTPARAPVARAARTSSKAPGKPAKKAGANKAAKTNAAKPAKSTAAKTEPVVAASMAVKPPVAAASRKAAPLSLPAAAAVIETPAAKPVPIGPKAGTLIPRADRPPADGFTLLVDGHFKSQFDDLENARTAASELKGRFPMLRIEIYDAAKKMRLPA